MRALLTMERRLQDLETRQANQVRYGIVTDAKFDSDKKRWFVKMEDGDGDDSTFKSDWLPWKSFSHGTISMSVPPRKKQKVAYMAPSGQPEMAYVEPSHNDPDHPSPDGKPDEIHRMIESGSDGDGDKWEHWKHDTDRSYQIVIRKKAASAQSASSGSTDDTSGKAKRERKMPEVGDDGDDNVVQIKTTEGGALITVNKTAKIHATGDTVTVKLGGSTLVMKDDSVEVKTSSFKIDSDTFEVSSGSVTYTKK